MFHLETEVAIELDRLLIRPSGVTLDDFVFIGDRRDQTTSMTFTSMVGMDSQKEEVAVRSGGSKPDQALLW